MVVQIVLGGKIPSLQLGRYKMRQSKFTPKLDMVAKLTSFQRYVLC